MEKEDYTDAATPDVTYFYTTTKTGTTLDPLGRITFVDDGSGTHALTYKPLTASTAGAGRLAKVDGPLANDSVLYDYDWQDRAFQNKLQSDASTPVVSRTDTRTLDASGRVKTMTNELCTFTTAYTTNLDRVDSMTGPNSVVSTYAYFPNSTTNAKARQLQSITHSRLGTTYSS